jgi:hypothetical protein
MNQDLYMNNKQIKILHNTICGKIGINHDFQIQIEYDDFKKFINDIFSNQKKLENCIQNVKNRLFTTQREKDRNLVRPIIHVIPRFTKDEELVDFSIETKLGNKSLLTNTESINFINMCKFISKIGAILVKIGKGGDSGSIKTGYEYFSNLFVESFTGIKSNKEESLEDINSIKFNSFDISILDTNIELNTELFDEKIININKTYQRNKILYFINLFCRTYDITVHITIVKDKLKEITFEYIQLLKTPDDRKIWIFLFNFFILHPFYSGNGKIGRFLLNIYFIKHYNYYINISIPKNKNFFDDIISISIFKNYINNYVVNDNCIKLLINNNIEEYIKQSHNIFKCSDTVIDEIIKEFDLLEKTNIEDKSSCVMQGGNYKNYKIKYLKYKSKYIKLKKILE